MKNILKLIFTNPADSLSLFAMNDIDSLQFYEKNEGEGKYYLKSFLRGGEEKLIYNEKTKIDHDLEDIASAFNDFAKSEKLSFY